MDAASMDMTAAVLAAGLLLPPETSAHSALAQRGCMGEIYTAADRIPALWREIGEALRRAGVVRPVAAACYRARASGRDGSSPRTNQISRIYRRW
jgi:hypothetical protein